MEENAVHVLELQQKGRCRSCGPYKSVSKDHPRHLAEQDRFRASPASISSAPKKIITR